jgi:hypothetical protein
MRINPLLFILTICISFLSCEKDDLSITKESLIKKIITIPEDPDHYIVTEEFVYDSQKRLVQIIESTDNFSQSTYYEYFDAYILMQVPTSLPRTDKLYLNDEGLVIQVNDGDFAKSYEYDSEGFLDLEEYSISGGNVVEYYEEFQYMGEDGYYTLIEHFKYNYYENINTICYNPLEYFNRLVYHNGNDNIGIYFWGTQNKNLLKNIESPGYGFYKEFAYKFDKYNRVSEMEIIQQGEKHSTKQFEYCN